MTESDYRNSVKCKYCSHYRAEFRRCKCGGYTIDTTPDSVCKRFTLSPCEVILHKVYADKGDDLPQRGDGSYITEIPPFMRTEFMQEEEKEFHREMFHICLIIGVGLVIFWWIFGPFIEMIFGILT